MKILITGSSGFVGKHLVSLLSKNHKIIQFDLINGLNILNEGTLMSKMKNVDTVINLAAYISASESWEKPREYFENNSIGTLCVVRCAINAKVKNFIHFSSAAVKARPLTPYALSKKMSEQILELYKDKINIILVRPENIYGNGQKASYGYVIHSFIKAVQNNQAIKIFGDGKQIRDFIFVEDVVRVIEKIINKNIYNKTINLGNGKGINILDLARLISKLFGKKLRIEYLEKRVEPRKSIANIATLKNIGIDTKKFINLRSGIRKLN